MLIKHLQVNNGDSKLSVVYDFHQSIPRGQLIQFVFQNIHPLTWSAGNSPGIERKNKENLIFIFKDMKGYNEDDADNCSLLSPRAELTKIAAF